MVCASSEVGTPGVPSSRSQLGQGAQILDMAWWHVAWDKDLGASSSSQARWCMGRPCLLLLCAAAKAVSMLSFPTWEAQDAWQSPSQFLLEVLDTVGQVKGVRSLRMDLVLLTWVSMRYLA